MKDISQIIDQHNRTLLQALPWRLAEVVAKHYVVVSGLARTLDELVKRDPLGDQSGESQVFILEKIEELHRADFGLPPNWPVSVEKFAEKVNRRKKTK